MALGPGAPGRGAPLAARLHRPPPAGGPTLAAQELSRHSPAIPDEPASRLLARRRLGSDPSGTRAAWRQVLEAGAFGDAEDEHGATRALRTLHGIDAAVRLGDTLLAIAERLDRRERPRLAATLAVVLGDLDSAEAGAMLHAWLADDAPGVDGRVRANALEALSRRSRRLGGRTPESGRAWRDRLLECRSDDAHRVRASAVRALLRDASGGRPGGAARPAGEVVFEAKPGETTASVTDDPARADAAVAQAVGSLCSMLDDDRASHRLAGVWAAERAVAGAGSTRLGSALQELAGRLHGLAEREPDPTLRARAERCAGIAGEGVRAGWASSSRA